jgi:predicted transport protein
LSISPEVRIRSMKKYIALVRKRNFVDIVVRKSSLDLHLNMKKGTLNDHKNMARNVSNVGHWGNEDYARKSVIEDPKLAKVSLVICVLYHW